MNSRTLPSLRGPRRSASLARASGPTWGAVLLVAMAALGTCAAFSTLSPRAVSTAADASEPPMPLPAPAPPVTPAPAPAPTTETKALPLLDARAPATVRTATFALG